MDMRECRLASRQILNKRRVIHKYLCLMALFLFLNIRAKCEGEKDEAEVTRPVQLQLLLFASLSVVQLLVLDRRLKIIIHNYSCCLPKAVSGPCYYNRHPPLIDHR